MATLNHYRLWCITDSKWEYVWVDSEEPAPTLCPTNTAHTLDPAKTSIYEAKDDDSITVRAQTDGYQMCDRDIKVTTNKVTTATSVEDKRMDVTTLKEVDWDEMVLVGVYKDVSGTMTLCSDQADADANGILSIWDYCAKDQSDGTTHIDYEIKDGALVADPSILAADKWKHKVYAVAAPDAGQPNYVRLFDGYAPAHPSGSIDAKSPDAKHIEPTVPGVTNVIRVYIVHPIGESHEHVLRIVTYRPGGTF